MAILGSALEKSAKLYTLLTKFLNYLSPLGDLTLRVWLFVTFAWQSGLSKLSNWDSTLMLFKYEYEIPLIPSELAAYLGTAAELILPTMLLLGLFSRFAASGLFVFNIVAVFSYPFLWTDDGTAGFNQHLYWGVMMMVLMVHGPGRLSIDWLFSKKCGEFKY